MKGAGSHFLPSDSPDMIGWENMFRFGVPEFLILHTIIIVLFGVGRIGKIASELGTGLKAFKDNLRSDNKG